MLILFTMENKELKELIEKIGGRLDKIQSLANSLADNLEEAQHALADFSQGFNDFVEKQKNRIAKKQEA